MNKSGPAQSAASSLPHRVSAYHPNLLSTFDPFQMLWMAPAPSGSTLRAGSSVR